MSKVIRGRVSAYVHLKPAIVEMLKKGATPQECSHTFREVPLKTIKDWKAYMIKKGEIVEVSKPEEVPDKVAGNVAYLFNPSSKLPKLSEDDELPDILWAKRAAKKIYNEAYDAQTKLKAVDTFIKAVGLQASKPELAEIKVEDDEAEMIDYNQLTEEELGRLYREKIG